jgi:uncharacterized flavoprotein (TIGR03862 family)
MTPPSSPADIAIIGGGPAGLAAAEFLSSSGHRVTIYDRMPSLGRKFLLAGRGGLNLTHSEPLDRFLARYEGVPPVLDTAIRAFPPQALRDWSHGLGEDTFEGSSGRVFPRSFKASPLLRAWLRRLESQGVSVRLRRRFTGFAEDGALIFETPEGTETVAPAATILALGGASWARLGSDGAWTAPLAAAGIDIRPLRPANGGFEVEWTPIFRERFAGEPLKRIASSFAGRRVRGEAIVTEHGLEGGAIYALSAPLRDAIERDGSATLDIDLRPDLDAPAMIARLGKARGGASQSNWIRKALALPPVAIGLLREATGGAPPTEPAALAALVKSVPVRLTGLRPMDRAISTAGGVAFDALTDNLETKARPGLFVAGEMLDWEAPTGGYLLQACFATGMTAGRGVLASLERENQSSNN